MIKSILSPNLLGVLFFCSLTFAANGQVVKEHATPTTIGENVSQVPEEWVVVQVEKEGEFAETYLTQNNYDWSAGQNVKITGQINEIDLNAVKNLTSLKKLDLSQTTITSLPYRFLYDCYTILEVKLPSTLTSIGNEAFKNCSAMHTIEVDGITTIGYEAFKYCSSLTAINLTGVTNIGYSAFSDCGKLKEIDLSTVKTIEGSAFSYCESLESIQLDSAVKIESRAFSVCRKLKKVSFGEPLETIGGAAFSNTAIDSISLPKRLKTLSSETFENCESLVHIDMNEGLVSIESEAFYYCSSLKEITIPATVTKIGSNVFSYTGLEHLNCYASIPPAASSAFIGQGMDMSRMVLYVPPFSKDIYRNTLYWSDFYIVRSIEAPLDYILVDRPFTINLEECNEVVASKPAIDLRFAKGEGHYENSIYYPQVGQLTTTGEGTFSAGQLTISSDLSSRSSGGNPYLPTLINHTDKMRADNITLQFSFNDYYGSSMWYFVSLPYDVKVSDILPSEDTYWVVRRYNAAARAAGDFSSTWVTLANDETMEAGKGYIISTKAIKSSIRPTLSFTSGNSVTKNNLFRTSHVSVPLTEYGSEYAHNRSWNFIGNPYPCFFDVHYLNEEFTAPITIWEGSSYVAYSPIDDDLILNPYEAFFVQCPINTTEVVFKKEGRMHYNDYITHTRTRSATVCLAEGRNVFNFEIRNEQFNDRARIVLNPEASIDYELGRDASKFFAENAEGAQLYVVGDANYSISERPVADGLAKLGLRSAKEDEYTLSLSGNYSNEWKVIVVDNLTGKSVDLTKEAYQFTTSKHDASERFSVKFVLGDETSIESLVSELGNDANVTVVDLKGTIVYSGKVAEITVPTAGVYVVTNGLETRKMMLK